MPIRLMYVYLSIEKSAVGIELASRHESQEIRTIRGNAIALNTLYCCCCWWVLSSENLMMNWKFKLKRWYSLRVAVRPTENERCLGAPHTHTHTTGFDQLRHFMYCVWFIFFSPSFRLERRVSSSLLLMSFVFSVPINQFKDLSVARIESNWIEYAQKQKCNGEVCVWFGWGRAHKFLDTENQSNEISLFPWEMRIANANNTIRTQQALRDALHPRHNDNSDFENWMGVARRGATKTIAARPVTRAAHWSRLCHTKYIYTINFRLTAHI